MWKIPGWANQKSSRVIIPSYHLSEIWNLILSFSTHSWRQLIFSDDFSPFPPPPLHELLLLPLTDTAFIINNYTPDLVPLLFHNVDELILYDLFTPISDANRVVVRIEGANHPVSFLVSSLVPLSLTIFLSYDLSPFFIRLSPPFCQKTESTLTYTLIQRKPICKHITE